MIFHFYVDNNEQDYDGKGEILTGTTTMKYVEFPTRNVNELHLFVDKIVNDWSDHASFGDAKFKTSFEYAPDPAYILLVNVNDDDLGTVNIDPIKECYFKGEQIQLQAVENSNACFVKWIDGDGNTIHDQKEYVLTITDNIEITVVFEK